MHFYCTVTLFVEFKADFLFYIYPISILYKITEFECKNIPKYKTNKIYFKITKKEY